MFFVWSSYKTKITIFIGLILKLVRTYTYPPIQLKQIYRAYLGHCFMKLLIVKYLILVLDFLNMFFMQMGI